MPHVILSPQPQCSFCGYVLETVSVDFPKRNLRVVCGNKHIGWMTDAIDRSLKISKPCPMKGKILEVEIPILDAREVK